MKQFLKFFTLDDKNISLLFIIYPIIIINEFIYGLETRDIYIKLFLSELFPAFTLVFIKQKLSRYTILSTIYTVVMWIWIAIIFLIDFYCINILHSPLNSDIALMMLDSNPNESLEFINLYFSQILTFRGITILIIVIGLVFVYRLILRKIKYGALLHNLLHMAALLSCVSCFYVCYLPFLKDRTGWVFPPTATYFFQKTTIFFKFKEAPNLQLYYSHPKLEYSEAQLPENIVIILGESLSRNHCSLYGYTKNTNKKLGELVKSGNLFLADSVLAPAIQTVPAFKYFMSTYSHENQAKMEWYEGLTIMEIFDILGYKMQWISNQHKTGFHDNIITKYADLCDISYFVGDAHHGRSMVDNTYDGDLLPLLNRAMDHSVARNLYFIHLMGSHNLYKERYPVTFKSFSAEEYLDKPAHQRDTWAEYDTSVAYNDSVVNEMIQRFNDKEAVILYFSDHGQDFYQSDPNYAGHAFNTAESYKYGLEIPFMVYLSPQYMKNYPDKVPELMYLMQHLSSTENLIYFLMDIVGVKIKQ